MKNRYEEPKLETIKFSVEENIMTDITKPGAEVDAGSLTGWETGEDLDSGWSD